jgi:hypothetical protein
MSAPIWYAAMAAHAYVKEPCEDVYAQNALVDHPDDPSIFFVECKLVVRTL